MLRTPGLSRLFSISTRMASATPMEDAMRDKLAHAFTPSTLIIRNDSHKHAHHAAMQGSTSRETHFQFVLLCSSFSEITKTNRLLMNYSVTVTSEAFRSKPQPARHRMVYALFKEEMSRENGLHALQLKTRTPEEEQRDQEKSS
ncbi:BolA-like protein [Penicillium lagena]|uniref:BolA-like protein n=1 Tax=Penicillium lagena TaxID=94218 RepID=UPI00253F9925|nr:BolA-like protein [Penicillium lagena]KAJ5605245.1 BolA-like protein [Penicillium lagena]